MNKLYEAIKKKNLSLVIKLITNDKTLVNKPFHNVAKKDDGQSPLQIALKNNAFEIVEFLIDNDADINYIENDTINEWRAPVIHDAISNAIMNSRWNIFDKVIKVFHTKEESDKAFQILKKIVELGADVNAKDSYQNTCLDRILLDCRQILPYYDVDKNIISNDRVLTDEIKSDILRICELFINNGADINVKNVNSKKSFKESVKENIMCKFIKLK